MVPKALRPFFPALDEAQTSKEQPTIDGGIFVDMFVGVRNVGDGLARYQFQTWGGERSSEARLTDNLAQIRKPAKKGDILVFQRSAETLDRFRLILFRRRWPGYSEVTSLAGDRRWGPLIQGEEPVTTEDLENAQSNLTILPVSRLY